MIGFGDIGLEGAGMMACVVGEHWVEVLWITDILSWVWWLYHHTAEENQISLDSTECLSLFVFYLIEV